MFLTTHYLDEADALSDRILIIDQGRIVASDTPDNLKSAVAGDLVILDVPHGHLATAKERLAAVGREVVVDGTRVSARVAGSGRVVPGLLRQLDADGVLLKSIEIRRPTLDDVFLTMTGRSLRDAEHATNATDKQGVSA